MQKAPPDFWKIVLQAPPINNGLEHEPHHNTPYVMNLHEKLPIGTTHTIQYKFILLIYPNVIEKMIKCYGNHKRNLYFQAIS